MIIHFVVPQGLVSSCQDPSYIEIYSFVARIGDLLYTLFCLNSLLGFLLHRPFSVTILMLISTSAIQGDLLTWWPYWMGTYNTTVMRGNSLICGPTETVIHCDLLTLWPQMGICIHLSHCLLKLPALIARSPSWSHWDMLLNQPYIVIYSLCGPEWGLIFIHIIYLN